MIARKIRHFVALGLAFVFMSAAIVALVLFNAVEEGNVTIANSPSENIQRINASETGNHHGLRSDCRAVKVLTRQIDMIESQLRVGNKEIRLHWTEGENINRQQARTIVRDMKQQRGEFAWNYNSMADRSSLKELKEALLPTFIGPPFRHYTCRVDPEDFR